MSFSECIINGLKEKKLTKDQAEEAGEMFQRFEAENTRKMSPAQATAEASRQTFDALEQEAIHKKRRIILQSGAQRNAIKTVGETSKTHPSQGMQELLERKGDTFGTTGSVESRRKAYVAMAHSKIDNILAELKPGIAGGFSKGKRATSQSMVRAIFGEQLDNPAAKEMAKAWEAASELLRKAYNAAGGRIAKRADWGLPQSHDPILVGKKTQAEWVSFINQKLDWEHMPSEKTGTVIPDSERIDVLNKIYDTIITDGANNISPKAIINKGTTLANRRMDHRFLKFKSADDWMAYSDEFGGGEPFTIMMEHIERMSTDTALMEVLGPNPNSTISFLKTQLRAKAAKADAGTKKRTNTDALEGDFFAFENMYGVISGNGLIPVNQRMASGIAGLGNLLTSALLGSTSLLAVFTDAGTSRFQARLLGMPQMKLVGKQLSGMVAAKSTKAQMVRSGLVAENWSAVAYGQSRMLGDIQGPEVTQRISSAVMNVSLLSPWTQSARWAAGMEIQGFLADNVKLAFNDIPQELMKTLRKYDIGEDEWTKLQAIKVHDEKGATFLQPSDVFDADKKLGLKYHELIQFETDLAVPVASVRARAALQGGTRAGTAVGSLVRSAAQFKNFPVTFFLNNMRQLNIAAPTAAGKALLGAELLVTGSAMGLFAIQAKEIVKGRDPIPLVEKDGTPNLPLMGQALLTSGGLGIFGDFLFSNINRHGGGFSETVSGPIVGLLGDVRDLTIGNIAQGIAGEETKILPETVRFLSRYGPGTSIWYLRAGLERLVSDQLLLLTDPKAKQKFRRSERKRKKDFNQGFWWGRGDTTPTRGPDLSKVFGT